MANRGRKNQITRADLSWFDLSKYDAVVHFSLGMWANVLSTRRLLQISIEQLELDAEFREAYAPAINSYLAELLEEPVGTLAEPTEILLASGDPSVADQTVQEVYLQRNLTESGELLAIYLKCFPADSDGAAYSGEPVVSDDATSSEELVSLDGLQEYFQRRADAEARRDEAHEKHATLLRRSFADYVRGAESEGSLPLSGSEFVSVNLNASDETLRRDFDAWLACKRMSQSMQVPRGDIGEKELLRWARYRVLAYIDLRIFAASRGCTLPLALAGNVLFPDEDIDPAERISSTVRPLADMLMSLPFVAAVSEQAARAVAK